MTRNLQSAGYIVYGPATTGAEAVNEAATQHPDLVLMDINLSGNLSGNINGIEAAEVIRADSRDIPFIFMTSYSDPETLSLDWQANPSAFLFKPISAAQLQRTIQSVLDDWHVI